MICQTVSPPELFRHGGGHAGFGDDAGHLLLVSQNHKIGGAAGDELVKAVLGVVLGVNGWGVAADQGLDGFDHMAGKADVGDGDGALILALIVHHQQGVHVVALHLADALVDTPVGRDGVDAGAHEVGGGQVVGGVGLDEFSQKVLDLPAGGVGQHLLRGRHLYDLAVVHEDDHVGQVQRFLHVVGDKDDGLVQLLLEVAHLLLEGAAGHGVQGGEGFIHENDRGRGSQGAENADALLLAAGHLAGVLMGVLLIGKIDHLQKLAGDAVALLLAVFQEGRYHADVLGHRHIGKQSDLLNNVADMPAQVHLILGGDVLAVQIDLSAGGFNEAVDHFQGGGLSAAGGANQNGHLSVRDLEGQIVQNLLGAIGQGDVFKLKQWGTSFAIMPAKPWGTREMCAVQQALR